MSKHPTERIRSVQEIQAKASLDSDKALRRVALAEERLARVEGRLAERDELIAEFREAYGRQADTLNAMGAVVRELESKVGRGVDQVITGLEGRIKQVESEVASTRPRYQQFFDLLIDDGPSLRNLMDATVAMDERLQALESKPKRGRPKGSKNKPKDSPAVEDSVADNGNNTAQDGDSSNPEASEA